MSAPQKPVEPRIFYPGEKVVLHPMADGGSASGVVVAADGDGYRVRVTREVWVAACNLREASL